MAVSVCKSLEEAFILQLTDNCLFAWFSDFYFFFIVVNICIAYSVVFKFITLAFYLQILERSLGITLAMLSDPQMTTNLQKNLFASLN